jgi:hypothetical protein
LIFGTHKACEHLQAVYGMSERRACRTIGADRASVRYRSRRPPDEALRERLRQLANERRRFGYRRLYVLLRREGHMVNRKRVYRLYKAERLMVRRRSGRKRALGMRAPIPLPSAANERWSLDFVHDQMVDGRRFRILAVVDDCTRECLALVPDTSLPGLRVARELDRVVASSARPAAIISDNGFNPLLRDRAGKPFRPADNLCAVIERLPRIKGGRGCPCPCISPGPRAGACTPAVPICPPRSHRRPQPRRIAAPRRCTKQLP